MDLPDPYPVAAIEGPIDAVIRPPGSKSLTCRAYVMAALARGESLLRRPLRSDDTDRLLAALTTLGARPAWEGDDVRITGVGGRFPDGGEVNLGDGGTPARFMIAAASLAEADVVVDGSPQLRGRPMGQLVQLLQHKGADATWLEDRGRLPVRVSRSGVDMTGGTLVVPPAESSQFVSALMLIAPHLEGGLSLRLPGGVTSQSYVELTAAVLRDWGVHCAEERGGDGRLTRMEVRGVVDIEGRTYDVEPDASSAVYWLTAAAIVDGATIRVEGLPDDSVQPDAAYARILDASPFRGGDVDMSSMPDAAVCLAAAAATASAPVRISGLRTLRVKETDRIAALTAELERLGCRVSPDPDDADDALTIDPAGRHDEPVVIRTYDDHRMAMAFAILGLARGGVSIENPGCVAKSYPTFWEDLETLRS